MTILGRRTKISDFAASSELIEKLRTPADSYQEAAQAMASGVVQTPEWFFDPVSCDWVKIPRSSFTLNSKWNQPTPAYFQLGNGFNSSDYVILKPRSCGKSFAFKQALKWFLGPETTMQKAGEISHVSVGFWKEHFPELFPRLKLNHHPIEKGRYAAYRSPAPRNLFISSWFTNLITAQR